MSAGDRPGADPMRNCRALCQYEITASGHALALSERLLALRRRRSAAHLAPQVIDAEQTREAGEAAEVSGRPEARHQAAHQNRAQCGADAVESEQSAARGHHLRRLQMVIDVRHAERVERKSQRTE